MHRLPLIALLVIQAMFLWGQSPHGENYAVDCKTCHSTGSWEIDIDTFHFNHDTMAFALEGQHLQIDCRSCHVSLIFEEAPMQCASCHQDMHSMTVGNDCARCHDAHSWLVDKIPEIHEENGFPLIGAHDNISCEECHTSFSELRFERIGNDCINCHRADFQSTTSPDHEALGFSMNCIDCHDPLQASWSTDEVDHSFFPLTAGHDIQDCNACHNPLDYSDISAECVNCHINNFIETLSPDHEAANFSQDCALCHTTEPGWSPAEYVSHDNEYFPIYSGAHQGEWTGCVDCHTNPDDYSQFRCTNCHINPETDEEHEGISGYTFEDNACLACHPTGSADMAFDHNTTNFPLTGAHIGIECLACHSEGFEGTPTHCAECHTTDFNNTVNPDHQELNIPMDCAQCHTTDPQWMPASFDIHDNFYPLNGAHAQIRNDCAACHNGDYVNTPNTCVGCHLQDFNNTTEPDHVAAQFSQDCASCHNEDAWVPTSFDHDGQYFPIYTGKHEGEWVECIDCHTTAGDFTQFSCTNCHINPETDDQHLGVSGYIFEDNACLACHPTGDADIVFDHNSTSFPLTGSHMTAACLDCHSQGFEGTPTHCSACHTIDYDNSSNPDHQALNIPMECDQCHNTGPGWSPATFAIHDDYYPLIGAHAGIAHDCASCHNGDYQSTPNTCVGCHLEDYNNTTDPDHVSAQFSQDCATCHNEDAWIPSTFDHDAQFFPIYTGAHEGEWMECIDCHTTAGNYGIFSCTNCHINPETDDQHMGVNGYAFQDNACLACHPTGEADVTFDHNTTSFPLTGAHMDVECLACHLQGFEGTSTYCADCHTVDFNNTSNPNHQSLNIPMDCAQCHTTDPGWMPATFDIHDNYYPLIGAHANIASDCATCHNGDYINTPNTCVGCHLEDFNTTTDPDHVAAQFSQDCASCHSEDVWVPATFDHDGQYFPIYTGAHEGEWVECIDCHTTAGNYAVFSCTNCHINPETDDQHMGVSGYVFQDNACLACHPTGEADVTFDHNTTSFPLTGAHIGVECLACHSNGFEGTSTICADCHTVDFNATTNPDHQSLNIPMDCAQCHTTDPGWMPATFDIHDNYYPLNGAHANIANDCASCHNGDYVNTPNTCVGCHLTDYNNTTDPDHQGAQFSTECASCHSEDAWIPATFDHDGQYFPIYSGAHDGEWVQCIDCHTTPGNFALFSCINCHINPETDNQHSLVNGYIYEDNACLACHPDGNADMPFSHDNTAFPLTGGHIGVNCIDCHQNGYQGTSTICEDCHMPDYNASSNPDHNALSIPTDCATCHTTDPGWAPASFDIHDNYYVLTGAHQTIAPECALCHNGDYNNTPNTCEGCHIANYNATTNPDHNALGIPTDCATCHTTNPGWIPASFDIHDNYYPLTGAHQTIAAECALCHNGDYNNTPNTCNGCHMPDYNASTNPDHNALGIPTDCANCHTTDPQWMPATFDIHNNYYPLNGAHAIIANDCVLCHNGDYNNTPNTCFGCHSSDYNNTTNPDHGDANFPTDCTECHTEDAWTPSTFDHNQYYPLIGAHAIIANDCNACHMGNYSNTPNTCFGCHDNDYNMTTNPDHGLNNLSTNCTDCHNQDAWMPSTFDHSQYYQLNGAHALIANNCFDCHMGTYPGTPNTCFGCHDTDYNNTTNPDHQTAQFPTTCQDCHTEDAWIPSTFDHDGMYFPIYSGRHQGEWNDCVDCHTTPGDFTVFSCIDCHEHNDPVEMAEDHNGVSGYVYESNACYACHPDGDD